jgi:hypothetical protein
MYDAELRPLLLRKLARWGKLPLSDLLAALSPEELLRYRSEALDDLEWDGFVRVTQVGDEPVVSITERGLAWLEEQEARR